MSDLFTYDRAKDRPVGVEITDGLILVTLADGRVIGNPLDWHPWLARPRQNSRHMWSFITIPSIGLIWMKDWIFRGC